MARASGRRRNTRGAPASNANWLSGLACGAMLAFATSIALLVGVLFAPAALAAVLETAPSRPVTRAMALCASGFVLAPVWHLVQAGRTLSAALDVLSDPLVIGAAWLAGICGWALCEILPVAFRIAGDMQTEARMNALSAEEAALRAEWDMTRV